MTEEDTNNSLADNSEQTSTDAQHKPMCIWATISMWCLLGSLAMFLFVIVLGEYRSLALILRCFVFCSSYLILFSPVSAIIALVLIKRSGGRLRGVERAGTCMVLSLMVIIPSSGIIWVSNAMKSRAEMLAPFREGDIAKARELLAEKPEIINERVIWGDPPMHAAASNGHCDIIELLIESGAKVDILSRSEETPLHVAAKKGRSKVVRLLLDKGANIEARDSIGETPLHEGAVAYENGEAVVRVLLERGADPTIEDNNGKTPLDVAKKWGHEDVAKVLRE